MAMMLERPSPKEPNNDQVKTPQDGTDFPKKKNVMIFTYFNFNSLKLFTKNKITFQTPTMVFKVCVYIPFITDSCPAKSHAKGPKDLSSRV